MKSIAPTISLNEIRGTEKSIERQRAALHNQKIIETLQENGMFLSKQNIKRVEKHLSSGKNSNQKLKASRSVGNLRPNIRKYQPQT